MALKPIRPIGPALSRTTRPSGAEIGAFILVLFVLVAGTAFMFTSGLIDEVGLLLAILFLLIIVYVFSPQWLVELKEYERAVIFRFGKFQKVAGPGWVFVLPFIEEAKVLDKRVRTVDIKPQKVLTRDNIELVIDAIVFLGITDPKAAVLNIESPVVAVTEFTQAHLRDVIGHMPLTEVISEVETINAVMLKDLKQVSKDWGVTVSKVEIQSLTLPEMVKESMHKREQAEQLKYAAKEEAAAHELKINAVQRAAGKLSDPALKYLYFQALEKVAEGRSSKIIFPLELSHLAESISSRVGADVSDELRDKYDEFLLEESRKHPEKLLRELKKKRKREPETHPAMGKHKKKKKHKRKR